MSNLVGKEIGVYQILDRIGGGGMSSVYVGYHAALDQRFRQEVQVIAQLQHPHIVPIYDYGQDAGWLYLAMRYIERGTLADRLDRGPMALAEVGQVMHQVGAALAYAHREGLVHRDVKPGNVLIDAQGDCFLSDFGLAKTTEASIRLTAIGVGMGTPAYMSPEQGKGEQVDGRSDVYSLGAMLYELVTGRVPYEGRTAVQVMLQHISSPVPLPSRESPDLSPAVDEVILRALAKDPAARFQSVGGMLRAWDNAALPSPQPIAVGPGAPAFAPLRRAGTGPEARTRPARTALFGTRPRELLHALWATLARLFRSR
jgi:serine/threonine protein kinase